MRSTGNESRGLLLDMLEQHASAIPNTAAFVWHDESLAPSTSISYLDLSVRSRALAAVLQQCYLPGERAMLAFPHGVEFIVGFLACLQAGLIAVPVCPPRPRRPDPKLSAILNNALPAVVLADNRFIENRDEWCYHIPELCRPKWRNCEAEPAESDFQRRPVSDSTIALLQYTSGTTGDPKGVMVSHGNLRANATTIRRAIGPDPHSQRVFWLPMYHDMGLIGAMIQTIFDGASSACISPATFLRRPLSWLELISRTGASFSGAPDFAYDLCVQRSNTETRKSLNLSSWRVAVSGAETIRHATIERFCEAFAPCGFRPQTFQPGYGLAEATLVVTHTPYDSPTRTIHVDAQSMSASQVIEEATDSTEDSKKLASSGGIGHNQHVAIVDSRSGRLCNGGEIGEIWVAGPNIACGYYNNAEQTQRTFRASLPNDEREYLRTGDLGFLHDGHLFVAGRMKEVIVVRGRNIYPQDVERAVRNCDPRVATTHVVAFSVDLLGRERLVVIQEFPREHRDSDFDDLGSNIRRAIGCECGVEVFDLLFVREGSLPRTSSGKVRRVQCREDYRCERYTVAARWTERQPESDTDDERPLDSSVEPKSVQELHEWLVSRICQKLDVTPEKVNTEQAFVEMGLGSLDIVAVCDEFERFLGRRLPPTLLFNYPTISALAEALGEPDEPRVISLTQQTRAVEALRAEVDMLERDELEAFIAEQMAEVGSNDRRAA